MFAARWLILTLGPVALIGTSFALTAPQFGAGREHRAPPRLPPPQLPQDTDLASACAATAAAYRLRLPADWHVLEHPPYVLAGDLAPDQLQAIYRRTLLPTARALQIGFFDTRPTAPVSVLLLSDEAAFQRCTDLLGDGDREEYAGIYVRDERRIVLNVSTGEGTLSHELTHALAHFDCPSLPEWFDEGLASLAEECEFSEDGLRLIGLPNWRGRLLADALRHDRLPFLTEFVSQPFGKTASAPLDYACARYLCLYLQDRQLLGAFYRKCRTNAALDPTGGWSLAEILGHADLAEADHDFRRWIAGATAQPFGGERPASGRDEL